MATTTSTHTPLLKSIRRAGAWRLAGGLLGVAEVLVVNGSDTAGRLGIGGWMLMFAILGYGLTRIDGRHA